MQDNYDQILLLLTLFNMGLFGGFLHCSSMCSPFVIHQVSIRLKNQEIDKYRGLEKLKNLALIPYHLGRIFTYAIIGGFCSYLAGNVRDFGNFQKFSGIILILAAILMILAAFKKKIVNLGNFSIKFFSIFPKVRVFKDFLGSLFANPTSYRGFILGIFLGFLPCGLLYSAFIIAASITNTGLAFIGMVIFGLGTFPALFLVGSTSYLFLNYAKSYIKIIARLVILINSVTILLIGMNLIYN